MDSVAAALWIVLEVVVLWTLVSIVVAFPVTALFRAHARREELARDERAREKRERRDQIEEALRRSVHAGHRADRAAKPERERAEAVSRPA